MKPIPLEKDLLKSPGAHRLRANIVKFWTEQGYPPHALAVDVIEEAPNVVVIRSNFRNGTPPGTPARIPKKFV